MAMVNISKDYRKYSSQQLRDKAYMGTLECNGYDLSDFLEYIFQDMHSEQELKEAFEEGKKEALDNEISICSECEEEIY